MCCICLVSSAMHFLNKIGIMCLVRTVKADVCPWNLIDSVRIYGTVAGTGLYKAVESDLTLRI